MARKESAPLLDPAAYDGASPDQLKAERLTIGNRLSGIRTQLGRVAGDADKTAALQARQADLVNRRAAIAERLSATSGDLAEATGAAAAAKVNVPKLEAENAPKPASRKRPAAARGRGRTAAKR